MTDYMALPIPVFMSRHTPSLPEGYGAFIDWEIGEKVKLKGKTTTSYATIKGNTGWHHEAPEIEGAHGRGRWVRDVIYDGEREKVCVSTANIYFDDR